MNLIVKSMSEARLIRHSAAVVGGRRPETSSEIKTVRAAAVVRKASKAMRGETYSPIAEYEVFTLKGAGLEYYDTLQFKDGLALRITSARPVGAPGGSAISLERYSAEERND